MSDIYPFTIAISGAAVEDLKTRLALARLPDELADAGWDLGTPLRDVVRLITYWKDTFDWRASESEFNRMPHYKTPIDVSGFGTLDIHFIHQKSKRKNAVPLIFIHGWPGSFMEATKILDLLSDGGEESPAFDVVVPSLPNHGFSSGVTKRGFGYGQYAEVCHKLMLKLGYEGYVTQGGDHGYYISRAMSLLYPAHCLATHLNFEYAEPPSVWTTPWLAVQSWLTPYTEKEKSGLEHTARFASEGSGYQSEQSTKPQTIGYALNDSPVALLSWIYEKLHDWSDGYPWSDEEVCTWISIYWFSTAGPAASVRIYQEVSADQILTPKTLSSWAPGVKVGFSRAPKDVRIYPASWRRAHGDIVFERDHDIGGHFLAYERPGDLVADTRAMFGKDGPAFGIVPSRSGYEE